MIMQEAGLNIQNGVLVMQCLFEQTIQCAAFCNTFLVGKFILIKVKPYKSLTQYNWMCDLTQVQPEQPDPNTDWTRVVKGKMSRRLLILLALKKREAAPSNWKPSYLCSLPSFCEEQFMVLAFHRGHGCDCLRWQSFMLHLQWPALVSFFSCKNRHALAVGML